MPALRAAFCLVPQEPSARSQETRAEILKVLDVVLLTLNPSHLEGGFLASDAKRGLALGQRQQQAAQERLNLQQHPPPQVHIQRQRHLCQANDGTPLDCITPNSCRSSQVAALKHAIWGQLSMADILCHSQACTVHTQNRMPLTLSWEPGSWMFGGMVHSAEDLKPLLMRPRCVLWVYLLYELVNNLSCAANSFRDSNTSQDRIHMFLCAVQAGGPPGRPGRGWPD